MVRVVTTDDDAVGGDGAATAVPLCDDDDACCCCDDDGSLDVLPVPLSYKGRLLPLTLLCSASMLRCRCICFAADDDNDEDSVTTAAATTGASIGSTFTQEESSFELLLSIRCAGVAAVVA